MQEMGWGMPVNSEDAMASFRQAAESGDAKAQGNLGRMLVSAPSMKADLVQAYQWLKLGADQEEPSAVNVLRDIQQGMTAEQIAQGEELVREFRKKHPR